MTRTKTLYTIGGAVLAALIVVIVLLVIVINQNAAAARQDAHERAVAICEQKYADPYGKDLVAMTDCVSSLEK